MNVQLRCGGVCREGDLGETHHTGRMNRREIHLEQTDDQAFRRPFSPWWSLFNEPHQVIILKLQRTSLGYAKKTEGENAPACPRIVYP